MFAVANLVVYLASFSRLPRLGHDILVLAWGNWPNIIFTGIIDPLNYKSARDWCWRESGVPCTHVISATVLAVRTGAAMLPNTYDPLVYSLLTRTPSHPQVTTPPAGKNSALNKKYKTSCRRVAATICPQPATEARRGSLEPAGPDQPIRAIQPACRTRRLPTGCTRQTSDRQTSDSIIA